MIRSLPRFRSRRNNLVLIIVLGFTITYFWFLPPETLPEDLLSSPLYHDPIPDAGTGGSRTGAGLVPKWTSPNPSESLALRYSDDGLVRGWDAAHDLLKRGSGMPKREKRRVKEIRDTHPILELMEKGNRTFGALLARTLPQAVTEYHRRYNRPPPKGFEQWWQFCKKHGVKIVDDYDQINRDIEPFMALSPKMFRERAAALEETPHTYHIALSPSSAPKISGDRAHSARGLHLLNLLTPLAPLLPGPVKIHMSDHDMGSWLLGDDQRQAALAAVRAGRYLTEKELEGFEKREGRVEVRGLVSACPEGSKGWEYALAKQKGRELPDIGVHETTFIYDPPPTYDFCRNPSLLKTHGTLSFDFCRESELRPIFQLSKWARNPEFLTTPLEAYDNYTTTSGVEKSSAKYSPWAQKDVNKLFWRGSSTGDSYSKRKDYDWRNSHRPRLSILASETKGEKAVWVRRGNEWISEKWGVGRLNQVWMDVGLSGKPHQEDGTCDEMAKELEFKDRIQPEQAVKYKYVLDVDGNGWSSRFHRLLMSGSMVMKATIYPEWMSDWLTPWYHYVPVQVDYSDLYSVLSFFIGPPDGRSGGHDDLARQIAEQGRKFGLEHWRWEDMQAYMLRLLLE